MTHSNSKAKTYVVQGWYYADPKDKARSPLKEEAITTSSIEQAVKTYAHLKELPQSLYNDGSNKPSVVIRVSGNKGQAR